LAQAHLALFKVSRLCCCNSCPLVATLSCIANMMGLVDKTGLVHPGYDMSAAPFPPRGYQASRRRAEVTSITASVSSDSPAGLELHAEIALTEGGRVRHSTNGQAKSIFWEHPEAGEYRISVRASDAASFGCSYRVVLAGEGQKPFEMEECLKEGAVECFHFTVLENGEIRACQMLQQEAEDLSDAASTKASSDAE